MTLTLPFPGKSVTSTFDLATSMNLALTPPTFLHITSRIDDEATILKRFLHGMGHYAPNISFTNQKLEEAMRAEMHERRIECPQLVKTLHLAASLIEVC